MSRAYGLSDLLRSRVAPILLTLLESPVISAIKASRPSSQRLPAGASSMSVAEAAERRLQNSSYPSHRQLRCSYRQGALTLFGRVSSYYMRQTAQALVAHLEGVEELVDRIEVVVLTRNR